ncbi:MAG: anti-sigma factor family protein [Cyanophyceae cyanobacterium]
MDNSERDRFELLSAYLDGEVTPAERRQVQQWLDNDPSMQQLYARLLRLRQGIQHLPCPDVQQPSKQLTEAVFQQIDRQRNRRRALWGGGIAALVIGALSGLLAERPLPRFAQAPESSSEQLVIALNKPAVAIPAAATPAVLPLETQK